MSYLKRSKKVFAGFLGLAMALSMTFAGAVPTNAATVEELTAQIQSLLTTITALQVQLSALQGGSTSGGACYTFTQNLKTASTGSEVLSLQKFLNQDPATQIASGSSAGAPGYETSYFGPATHAGVVRFQNKYAADVLAPVGLAAGTGYWGPSSRAKANSLCTAAPGGGTGTTPPPTGTTGTSLVVGSSSQPLAGLAPEGAARVPFTRFTLTAGFDGAVAVNGVTVEKVGLGDKAVFDGVVLLDEMGNIMDVDKTLNANNQATIGGNFTVPAGTTKTYTIAANMLAGSTALDAYAGQVLGLSLVAVNTSATVSGSLPISGAMHTINATLSLGSVTAARGSSDPNGAVSKEVGTQNYTFTAVKFTAGSAEKVRLNSIRFDQSGSATDSDLKNVTVYVDGTAYTPTVSGRYYTANFGSGIVIDKGLSKEVIVRADIEGGSARTIAFDIREMTDVNVSGETFGYGITPTAGTGFNATSPVYDASVVTVSNGSMVVSRATSVTAQNVAIQQANQTLGGFDVEVKGEAINVGGMVFRLNLSTGEAATQVDNVTLVDANGAVLAGPVDATGATTDGTVTFSDSVTFPIGKTTIILKGQLTSDFEANDTIVASTTPSTSASASNNWTNVRGQNTGNTIFPTPYTAVSGSTMTIKSATLTITTSSVPAAQTVVAGAQGFTFANYQFDATASGEDVRFNTLSLDYNYGVAADDVYLTGCQLWDGATGLNTGSNVVNPNTTSNGDAVTFTLDSGGLVIQKGTVKTITLKCNVSSAVTASDSFSWDIDNAQTGAGLVSGVEVSVTGSGSGASMTGSAAGTLSVTEDSSSPSYKLGVAGSANNLVGVYRFTALNEEIDVNRVALQLSNTSASSSPAHVTKVTLKDAAGTELGSAIFTGTSRFATSTLNTDFIVPKNDDKLMYAYVDLAAIGIGQASTNSGLLIQVDWDGDDTVTTDGVGVASGTSIDATGSSTSVDGIRVMRTIPTVAKDTAPNAGKLSNGAGVKLMRFKVTADSARDAGIYKFTVGVATTSVTASAFNIFAFTDASYSSPVSGHNTGGQLDNANKSCTTTGCDVEIYPENTAGTANILQVPQGLTRYFEVRGTIASASTASSLTLTLQGDAAYPQLSSLMDGAADIDADAGSNDDFIWTPNSTTTVGITGDDFTNGYGVPGLPASGLAETLSF